MTFRSNLFKIALTLIYFCLPLIFFITLFIIDFRKTGYFDFNSAIRSFWIFVLFISLITIPGIILHLQYYQLDKRKSLAFNKSSIKFYSEEKFDKIIFNKIDRVEIHTLAWSYKLPWQEYGFTRIILKDGTKYLYTSLILECSSSALIFKRTNITVDEIEEFWTWPTKN